jgi:hypothetical protein
MTPSYRYWKLNPDQATVDTRKSPPDPIIAVGGTIGPGSDSPDRQDGVFRDGTSASVTHMTPGMGHNRREKNDSPV